MSHERPGQSAVGSGISAMGQITRREEVGFLIQTSNGNRKTIEGHHRSRNSSKDIGGVQRAEERIARLQECVAKGV